MKRIKLSQGKLALVDNEDFHWLNNFHWFLSVTPWGMYVYRQKMIKRKSYYLQMHREILKYHGIKIDNLLVDHRDNNGLNNQKYNLRSATNSQNQMNRKIKTTSNNSGYKGVTAYRNGKWRASTKINQKNIHLGYFDTKEQAAIAYNTFAKENFREFARLNQIGGLI